MAYGKEWKFSFIFHTLNIFCFPKTEFRSLGWFDANDNERTKRVYKREKNKEQHAAKKSIKASRIGIIERMLHYIGESLTLLA